MEIQNLKIFDKNGFDLNLNFVSFIEVVVESERGYGAKIYGVTNKEGKLVSSLVVSSGHNYNNQDKCYLLINNETKLYLDQSQYTIEYKDVNISNNDNNYNINTSKGIKNVIFNNIQQTFSYPSISAAAAIYYNPVSVGLVETETLFLMEQIDGKYVTPFSENNEKIVLEFQEGDSEIRLFDIQSDINNIHNIIWTDKQTIDLEKYDENSIAPILINTGFVSQSEGCYERILNIYSQQGQEKYLIIQITLNAISNSEDERYRTLLSNFGIPDPVNFPKIFKDSNINEALKDWDLINQKSKELVLEYKNIFPYIGTYKALVNVVKWLGYDDIYFKEWFKKAYNGIVERTSFELSYNAKDRAKMMASIKMDDSINLIKLRELSMCYLFNRDTGRVDEFGVPIVENVYAYNLNEVAIKLFYLKKWLEENILGLYCRIIDITGEGVYFEVFRINAYTTDNKGYNINSIKSITPFFVNEDVSLNYDDINIKDDDECILSLKEYDYTKWGDLFSYTWDNFVNYIYNPLEDKNIYEDTQQNLNNYNYINVGPIWRYPVLIDSIKYNIRTSKEDGTILGQDLNDEKYYTWQLPAVDNTIYISEGRINFRNEYKDTTNFLLDSSSYSIDIKIKNADIYDASNNIFDEKNILCNINFNELNKTYTINDIKNGNIITAYEDVFLRQNSNNSKFYYHNEDNIYDYFAFIDFNLVSDSLNYINFKDKCFLLLKDAEINLYQKYSVPGGSILNACMHYHIIIENFSYKVKYEYFGDRQQLFNYDPSIYSITENPDIDDEFMRGSNPYYYLNIDHTGKYDGEVFAWDLNNNMFSNNIANNLNVYLQYPEIKVLSDDKFLNIYENDASVNLELINLDPSMPIFPKAEIYKNIDIKNVNNSSFDVEVTLPLYKNNLSDKNYLEFNNLTIEANVIGDKDIVINRDSKQKFFINDSLNIIIFDETSQSIISQFNNTIENVQNISLSQTQITLQTPLSIDQNVNFSNSQQMYIQNITKYSITDYILDMDDKQTIFNCDSDQFFDNQNICISQDVSVLNNVKEFGITSRLNNKVNNKRYFNDLISTYTTFDNIDLSYAWKTYSNMICKIANVDINGYFDNNDIYLNPFVSDDLILNHIFVNVIDYYKIKNINTKFILGENNFTNFYYIGNLNNKNIQILLQPSFKELDNVQLEYMGDNLFRIYGELKQDYHDYKLLPNYSQKSVAVIKVDNNEVNFEIACDYTYLKDGKILKNIDPNPQIKILNDELRQLYYYNTPEFKNDYLSINPSSVSIRNVNILPFECEFEIDSKYYVTIEGTSDFTDKGIYEISNTDLGVGKNKLNLKILDIQQGVDKCFFIINVSNIFKYQVDINFDISYLRDIKISCLNDDKFGYFLDNTFKFEKYLFDKEYVLDNWGFKNQLGNTLYIYNYINTDKEKIFIIKPFFNEQTYLLGQKNIWYIYNHENGELILKVFNDNVIFKFEKGIYDVILKTYDIFGNTIYQEKEGIIIINNL